MSSFSTPRVICPSVVQIPGETKNPCYLYSGDSLNSNDTSLINIQADTSTDSNDMSLTNIQADTSTDSNDNIDLSNNINILGDSNNTKDIIEQILENQQLLNNTTTKYNYC